MCTKLNFGKTTRFLARKEFRSSKESVQGYQTLKWALDGKAYFTERYQDTSELGREG